LGKKNPMIPDGYLIGTYWVGIMGKKTTWDVFEKWNACACGCFVFRNAPWDVTLDTTIRKILKVLWEIEPLMSKGHSPNVGPRTRQYDLALKLYHTLQMIIQVPILWKGEILFFFDIEI
jgi:hypothetical protein